MTCSEPSMPHRKMASALPFLGANHLIGTVTTVTKYERRYGHARGRQSGSPSSSSNNQSSQQLEAVAPAQNPGRRVEAGAGATPVFVAMIRHDTSLVRWLSLVGRSRTCPPALQRIPIRFAFQKELITKE
jgi:hypothetical protein